MTGAKVVKAEAQQGLQETVKVAVVHPFQVAHEATVFGPGEAVSVPPEVAEHWVRNGWVERVK